MTEVAGKHVMNWRAKSLMHWILSYAPYGNEVHYLIQKKITKTLPRPVYRLENGLMHALNHVDAFRRYAHGDIGAASLYEFGAGADLFVQLLLYSFGVNRLTTVDIYRLLRPELVNNSIKRISQMKPEQLIRLPERLVGNSIEKELGSFYGIDYRAPFDARKTGLPENSFDFIISSETVQFIPEQDLIRILEECYRLLKQNGLVSLSINCDDVYSYSDNSISVYNFLQYSDSAWRLYCPPRLFQNRLRHSDYLQFLRGAGLEILTDDILEVTNDDLNMLESVPLDAKFMPYSLEELAVRRAHLVLRKKSQ